MANSFYALNEERGCLRLAGEDARSFLQGMVSNDIDRLGPKRALFAGFFTAQGRFLNDLFLATDADNNAVLLDGEAARLDALRKRLTLYKLRAKVTIEDARDDFAIVVMWGQDAPARLGLSATAGAAHPWGGGIAFVDPRLASLGCRAFLPRAGAAAALEQAGFVAAPLAQYQRLRASLGVPEGSRDMAPEQALPLENGFDALNGVDFLKGCYVGQELTARMKHRALVKKRLYPVEIEGPAPAPGTPITLDGQEAGEMRGSYDGVGLALLKLDAVESAASSGKTLAAGAARLSPYKATWMS